MESQFDIVLRRQRRVRPKGEHPLKTTGVPSRFLNLTNDFEIAGWGTFQRLQLEPDDREVGLRRLEDLKNAKILGQFTASAVAGNAVLGSVFYALPAVVAVAGIYTPICLLAATMTLFLWRPILTELCSALPISGAPYTYILNVSTKTLALVGAAILLLDFTSTSVVSAATAMSYLAGEIALPFPQYVGVILILAFFTLVSLSGIKESARMALCVLTIHVASMFALTIAGIVQWGRVGNTQISANWHAVPVTSAGGVVRQLFKGFCLGVLGLTGFECVPSYVGHIKPGRLPLVLRNLHYPAILITVIMSLLSLALIPLETILGGANVLSVLAEMCVGKWLRIWIVVDAMIVLCGGVLTGILSACELFAQLAHDRILPRFVLRGFPLSGAPYISVISFIGFCGIIYATTGANLSVVSKMFSLVWLTAMTLFPLSLLLLKFNRGRLPRDSTASLSLVYATLLVALVIIAGNIYIDPITAAYFAIYFIVILILFSTTQHKLHFLRWLYWTYDQYPTLHKWHFTKDWGQKLVNVFARLKRQAVCVLVKTDEINHLFHMILYVSKHEETSTVKVVHFLRETGVPSELEANVKILDEAFPEFTIDLVLVQDRFSPENVTSLAHRLQIPTSLMFMTCPGENFPHSVADLGTRVISL
ncbi:AAAP amino acid permease [Marasmius fiardii PR-910]|nr:AAAP amino acid permease [Marasmius fiardii PR-910]